jgi:hypothetical protein
MAGWAAFRTVSRACSLQNQCFESSRILRCPMISKDNVRSRRVGAEELWDEQMFEFGASHKPVRCYGVRINIRGANNSWNYSTDGHSALISTNATHEAITSRLPVVLP